MALFRFYDALRIAFWVVHWLMTSKDGTMYRIAGINRYGIEQKVLFIGKGRDAWRISHLAIEAWKLGADR